MYMYVNEENFPMYGIHSLVPRLSAQLFSQRAWERGYGIQVKDNFLAMLHDPKITSAICCNARLYLHSSAICCNARLYLHSSAGRHPELLRQLPVPSQHFHQSPAGTRARFI